MPPSREDPAGVPNNVLQRLFRPRSVAIVGASERSPWLHAILPTFEAYGFDGTLWLINPRGEPVLGRPTHKQCTAIGKPVDVAFLTVPAHAVTEALEDVAAAGIRSAVVLASGFAETGEEGAAAQRALTAAAHHHGITMLGPNSMGFYDTTGRGCATAMRPQADPGPPGPVAIVSQSGATCDVLRFFAAQQGIGTSVVVATGNEAMVDCAAVLDWLVDDDATRAMVLFAETVRDPQRFARAAARAHAARKPVVVLKVGRSAVTSAVAQAHTGGLVGDDRVFDAVCARYGIIRVDSVEEAMTTAHLLAATGPLARPGAAVASISGGACEMLADLCEPAGVELPPFAAATQQRLRGVVSEFGAMHNPLDVTGAAVARPEIFEQGLQILSADPAVGLTVAISELVSDPSLRGAWAVQQAIGRGLQQAEGPGIFLNQYLKPMDADARRAAAEAGIPAVVSGLEHGARAMGHLARWSARLRAPLPARPKPRPAQTGGTRPRGEYDTLAFLAAQGVPVVPSVLAADAAQAEAGARRCGARVAMKIASPDIAHKTDAGGVRLDVGSADAAATFDDILHRVRDRHPVARIDGVLVAPMRPPALELIVGVSRDPQWGPVIVAGFGGIHVEVLQDSALRLLPIDTAEAVDMLQNLRGARLLRGARGLPTADIDALADAIVRIGEAALALGDDLVALEVNPLRVDGADIEALDALAVWRDDTPAAPDP